MIADSVPPTEAKQSLAHRLGAIGASQEKPAPMRYLRYLIPESKIAKTVQKCKHSPI
jgi:hypothetical protein